MMSENIAREKKKHIAICVVACTAVVLVTAICRLWPRPVPLEECSEVYRQYSQVEGVRATYLKDYPVNDTLTVGVTLLEATTDSAWVVLQEDFGVPAIPKEYEELFYEDSNRVSVKVYPKTVPLYVGGDTITNDLVITSRYKRTILHFVITSREQKRAITRKAYNDNIEGDNATYYSTNN